MTLYARIEKIEVKNHDIVPIAVFLAFTIESYLNSLGSRHISAWNDLERLPWKSKIAILYSYAKLIPDWGAEPLQFAVEVFKLRDRLAHGKPERVVGPLVNDLKAANAQHNSGMLEPAWYTSLNKEWALNSKKKFHYLMTHLGSIFDEHESDHLMIAKGGTLIHSDS